MPVAFMNASDGGLKLRSLVDALADCDRRRVYDLSVATCYCSVEAVRQFIIEIRRQLRIKYVYLYLDRRAAIAIEAELRELAKDFRDVLWIYVIKGGRLFHTKGYCVAAYSDDELVEGRLAIGSANLTNPGLTEAYGNVESLAMHTDLCTITEFLEFFDDEESLITLEQLSESLWEDKDHTDFQYALLKCGLFSHKWSATLSEYCSVRFELNEKSRQRAQLGLEGTGFETDAVSIAKKYFDFDVSRWQANDNNLIRNYGIECFLGHWIPKPVVNEVQVGDGRFKQFETALSEKFDSKKDSMLQGISRDRDLLIDMGLIDEPEVDPGQAFVERFDSLKNDGVQLPRIWSGRHHLEFPYDLADVNAIQDTYRDLKRSVERRKHKNKAMNALLEAESKRSLEPLRLMVAAE